jgi:hypothetical protein
MLRILVPVLTGVFLTGAAAAEKPKAPLPSDDYLNRVSAMAEYRSQVELAVADIKRRVAPRSALYTECRESYARAEESMDTYLVALTESVEKQERTAQLLRSADLATRTAEEFLGCAMSQKSAAARLIPIAPFVEFAIVCLERFISRKNKRSLGPSAELLVNELRWRSWDRIR